MRQLTIRAYKKGSVAPDSTIRIPLHVISMFARFVPSSVRTKLLARGVVLDELIGAATNQVAPGVLFEAEDDDERVVITIEESQQARLPSDTR